MIKIFHYYKLCGYLLIYCNVLGGKKNSKDPEMQILAHTKHLGNKSAIWHIINHIGSINKQFLLLFIINQIMNNIYIQI